MRSWTTVFTIATSLILSTQAYAASNLTYKDGFYKDEVSSTPYHALITISGGGAFSDDVGRSVTFPVIDDSTYAYTADKDSESSDLFGIFGGVEFPLYQAWSMQLGLGYYQTDFDASGALVQGPDALSADTYQYKYSIKSEQVLVESKFLMNNFYRGLHPYLSAGLGAAFNKSKDYSVNNPTFLTFSPLFRANTETSFTYNVGFGIDFDIPKYWRVGVGYRFTDLGKSSLGVGRIDTTAIGSTLRQSHLYAHEVMAQLTFIV